MPYPHGYEVCRYISLERLAEKFKEDDYECLNLSRIHSMGACAKEPQRREGRREKSEGKGPQFNHRLVTDLQAAEAGPSLRSSRFCGLMGLRSSAWLRLSSQSWHEGKHHSTPWTNFLFAIIWRGSAEFEPRAGQVQAPRRGTWSQGSTCPPWLASVKG